MRRGLGVGVSLFALLLSWTLAAGLHHTIQVPQTRLASLYSVWGIYVSVLLLCVWYLCRAAYVGGCVLRWPLPSPCRLPWPPPRRTVAAAVACLVPCASCVLCVWPCALCPQCCPVLLGATRARTRTHVRSRWGRQGPGPHIDTAASRQ